MGEREKVCEGGIPGAQRLVCELLVEGQHQQEVVDGALALQVGGPLSQPLGQLLAAGLKGEHALVHCVDLGDHVHPQQVAIAADGGDHVRVQPAGREQSIYSRGQSMYRVGLGDSCRDQLGTACEE